MKLRYVALSLGFVGLLAACGGGGSSSGGSSAVPAVTPGATVAPSPRVLSSAAPLGINAASTDATSNGSNATLFPNSMVNTAPSPAAGAKYSAVDGIPAPYSFPAGDISDLHFHTHLTVLDANGNRAVIPLGIGMIGTASAPLTPIPNENYPLTVATNGGSIGTYYLHTHDHSGMIHVEDSSAFDAQFGFAPPSPYTIGTLMNLIGQTADRTHFTTYATGSIHVYISQLYVQSPKNASDATTEVQTAPIEWTGDINAIPLQSFEEITVETTDKYYPVPRYYFPSYWCKGDPKTAEPNCALDAAPSNVVPATVFRKPAGFIEHPDPTT